MTCGLRVLPVLMVLAVRPSAGWPAQDQDRSEAWLYEALFKTAVALRQPKPGAATPRMTKDEYERYWQEDVGVSLEQLAEIERIADALRKQIISSKQNTTVATVTRGEDTRVY